METGHQLTRVLETELKCFNDTQVEDSNNPNNLTFYLSVLSLMALNVELPSVKLT